MICLPLAVELLLAGQDTPGTVGFGQAAIWQSPSGQSEPLCAQIKGKEYEKKKSPISSVKCPVTI